MSELNVNKLKNVALTAAALGSLTGGGAATGDLLAINDISVPEVKSITLAELITFLNAEDATLRTLVATNQSGIATNVTNIATNVTNIGTNDDELAVLEAVVVRNSRVNATIGELNTSGGKIIVPTVSGQLIMVLGYSVTAIGGAAGAADSVIIRDDTGTPVVISTIAIASLVENIPVLESEAYEGTPGTVFGVGMSAPLAAGKNVTAEKVGSDLTTASSFNFNVQYVLIAV